MAGVAAIRSSVRRARSHIVIGDTTISNSSSAIITMDIVAANIGSTTAAATIFATIIDVTGGVTPDIAA